jgi:hypothetical protein
VIDGNAIGMQMNKAAGIERRSSGTSNVKHAIGMQMKDQQLQMRTQRRDQEAIPQQLSDKL